MKRVTITFDYEGSWGMPFTAAYDQAAATARLLDVLAANGAKSVFFVTGKLVDEYPDVIRAIHEHGHEIGVHGYEHEHMHNLSSAQLKNLQDNLTQTCKKLKQITGYSPRGFRAPYLMGPSFYDPAVYRLLAQAGFTWVSNREIRMPEELFRPDRIKIGAAILKVSAIRNVLIIALNLQNALKERSVNWLVGERAPFMRPEGLREFPLTSPLDCDLVGLPSPARNSGSATIAYATDVIATCYQNSGCYFNVNCHDWIIGSADRTSILSTTLSRVTSDPSAQYFLPGLEEFKS